MNPRLEEIAGEAALWAMQQARKENVLPIGARIKLVFETPTGSEEALAMPPLDFFSEQRLASYLTRPMVATRIRNVIRRKGKLTLREFLETVRPQSTGGLGEASLRIMRNCLKDAGIERW